MDGGDYAEFLRQKVVAAHPSGFNEGRPAVPQRRKREAWQREGLAATVPSMPREAERLAVQKPVTGLNSALMPPW